MKRPRGISLVELLLALTACSAILTLSTGLLIRIMRAEMRSRAVADGERTALRLSRTFRGDVWSATEATFSPVSPDSLVRLTLPGKRSVEYLRAAAGTMRILRRGGRIVARDGFAFSETARVTVERVSPGDLMLEVHPEATPDADAVITWLQVRASLSRNADLVAAEAAEEAVP